MTTPIQSEVDRRAGTQRKRPATLASSLGLHLSATARALGEGVEWQWPSPQYQGDPVAFARDVLGYEPWSRQQDVMRAIARPLARVAAKSGHKVGKSGLAAAIAWWFYCSFPNARVVMSSTTSRQVDRILWREVRMLHYRARAGLKPEDKSLKRNPRLTTRDMGGEPKILARSGMTSPDFREITGFTAKEAEAVAGISGENLLYIIDEASGVTQNIFEAIKGNMAGGARILLLSNPTRSEGEFFNAFSTNTRTDDNPTGYECFTIRSDETPNCVEGVTTIPGLATPEWVEMMARDYGRDSPFFAVRVLGKFVENEMGRIINLALILASEQRWDDTEDEGVLHIGLDPAGPSGGGDETVFCLRRGQKILSFHAFREQNEDAIVVQLVGIIRENRRPRERPIVKLDREGLIGSKVFGRLISYLQSHSENERPFELFGIRASDGARRDPVNFDRTRDELWENMRLWMVNGGAIPPDHKLQQELHCPEWVTRVDLKRKAEAKDELRRRLNRSPDRADAMALAVWDVTHRDAHEGMMRTETRSQFTEPSEAGFDPYDAEKAWRR